MSDVKTGDFTIMVKELMKALYDRRLGLTREEVCIVAFVAEQTIGQQCKFRQIPHKTFLENCGMPRSTTFDAIKSAKVKQLIKATKQKGVRGVFYAINEEFFGRIYSGEIPNLYYLDKYRETPKVHNPGLSKSTAPDFKGPQLRTFNSPKPAPRANSADPSHISSHIYSHLSKGTREFLNSRSGNTKQRWTTLVKNIIARFPDDESLMLASFHYVIDTNKDFLGNPIRSSALSLFESTDWEVMRAIQIAKTEKRLKKELAEQAAAELHAQRKLEADVSDPNAKEEALKKIRNLFGK